MREIITQELGVGVYSLQNSDLIPRNAAQDSLGWLSQDGYIEFSRGKLRLGADEAGLSYNKGSHVAYKADGTAVFFRKINTRIQRYNSATLLWSDVITGLTADAEYTFTNYSSLAGNFVYASGVDGIFKIVVANPDDYAAMYDSTKNFKGYSLIDTGRMLLWNTPTDKTGLYGSWIDAQDATVYTTVSAEIIGSGDGATKAFSGTLSFKAADNKRTCFASQIYGQIAAAVNITAITQAANAQITAAGHGLSVGDKVLIESVGGMTTINGLVLTVSSIVDANNFKVALNTSSAAAYTAGGTVKKVEVFTDDFNGVLSSNFGGTGTINYMTGAWSVTFNTAPINLASNILADYQWEMSNNKGVTDFTKSSPRQAGQGFVFRQDAGGDPIQTVIVQDGKYYSLKERSVYELNLTSDDTNATNLLFRKDIGVQYWRSSVASSDGMMLMDTSNPDEPMLTIIQRNITGDNLEPVVLAPQFDFSAYLWDQCHMDTYGEYVVFSGRTSDSSVNNRMFLFNKRRNSVDVLPYSPKVFFKDAGLLYFGDAFSENTYQVFSGFDDDGFNIQNHWIGKNDKLDINALKKEKWLQIKGIISENQALQVYMSFDNDQYSLVGTVLGTGVYVDGSNPITIGSSGIGKNEIGGGSDGSIEGYPFITAFKISTPKFSSRSIKLVAANLGYVAVESIIDQDIMLFANKLPSKYRVKQNVSLDGSQTDLPVPQ